MNYGTKAKRGRVIFHSRPILLPRDLLTLDSEHEFGL